MTPRPAPPTASTLSRVGAVAVVVLLLVLVPGAARGHGAQDGVRYRLTGVTPEVDGITVQVVRGLAGQLVLANDTDEVVQVLDEDGRPFLRIGPDGVEGDVASAAWAESDRPFGLGGGDPAPPAAGQPRWVRLSDATSWGWYDHRLHGSELVVPADTTGPTVLDTWSVPLQVGDREVTVAGETVGGPVLGFVSPRLVSDRQPAPGVDVTLLPGESAGVMLTVDEGREVVVRGLAGEPFLWFTPHEGVKVNTVSPTYHRTAGAGTASGVADAEATPTWQSVADGRRFGWIEPRAVAPEVDGNPAADTVLSTWAVPLEVDDREVAVLGELRWVRTAAGEQGEPDRGLPVLNLALAGAGVATLLALVAVRRWSGRRDA